jgi:replication-associated recombination protein RarA
MSNDTPSNATVKPVPPIPGFSLGYPETTPRLAFGADAPSPVKLSEKYRPKTLCDVFGQGSAICQLQGFIESPYPVAFLFDGPTGTGKTSTALALAAELGVDPNWSLIHIKSGEQDGDAVTTALRTLRFCAPNAGWKMIVVDEADCITGKASNLWLSALEDLPPRSVIVFTTNHPEKFADRFLDRCERITFRAGAQELSLDAETLLRHVWRSETGREDHPALESLPNVVDKHGNVSFRRLISAIESALRTLPRDETPAPSPEPIATPKPIRAELTSNPRTADSIIMDAIGAYRDAVAVRGRVNDGHAPVVAIWDALTGGQKSAVTRRLDAIGKDKLHKRGDRLASFAYQCSQGSPVTFPATEPTDPPSAPDDAPGETPDPFTDITADEAVGTIETPLGWEAIEADDTPAPVSGGCEKANAMTITEVYDSLPMSSKRLWKEIDGYPFILLNDIGRASWFRVIVEGRDIGVVQYYKGRKLCCHGRTEDVNAFPALLCGDIDAIKLRASDELFYDRHHERAGRSGLRRYWEDDLNYPERAGFLAWLDGKASGMDDGGEGGFARFKAFIEESEDNPGPGSPSDRPPAPVSGGAPDVTTPPRPSEIHPRPPTTPCRSTRPSRAGPASPGSGPTPTRSRPACDGSSVASTRSWTWR